MYALSVGAIVQCKKTETVESYRNELEAVGNDVAPFADVGGCTKNERYAIQIGPEIG